MDNDIQIDGEIPSLENSEKGIDMTEKAQPKSNLLQVLIGIPVSVAIAWYATTVTTTEKVSQIEKRYEKIEAIVQDHDRQLAMSGRFTMSDGQALNARITTLEAKEKTSADVYLRILQQQDEIIKLITDMRIELAGLKRDLAKIEEQKY